MSDDWKRFYTVKEVSKVMGLCVANVYEGLRSGKIPVGMKVGRRWLIPRARFDEWWGDYGLLNQRTSSSHPKSISEDNCTKELLPLLAFSGMNRRWLRRQGD